MMDSKVNHSAEEILAPFNKAYYIGRENSIYHKYENIVKQAFQGQFREVQNAITSSTNNDFNNPLLLNDILNNAIQSREATQEQKVEFTTYLLSLAPLVNLIKQVPCSANGRTQDGRYFLSYESAIEKAVSYGLAEVVRVFINLDNGVTLTKSNALATAARCGKLEIATLILNSYRNFTLNEYYVLQETQQSIDEDKLRAANIQALETTLRAYAPPTQPNTTQQPLENNKKFKLDISAWDEKASELQELIFSGRFTEAQKIIEEESWIGQSTLILDRLLFSIIFNDIETARDQRGYNFIKFLLGFEALQLSLAEMTRSIEEAAERNLLAVMELIIQLDNGALVANSAAVPKAFANEHSLMFELLMQNETIRAKVDFNNLELRLDEKKSNTSNDDIQNREAIVRLLNLKKQELAGEGFLGFLWVGYNTVSTVITNAIRNSLNYKPQL